MREEKDMLISQFIDNELDLDEKIEFVKEIRDVSDFAKETVEMLNQEKLMETVYNVPIPQIPEKQPKVKAIYFTFANAASLAALAASLMLVIKVFFMTPAGTADPKEIHRFVLHMPDAENVSIAGSFSKWQNINMQKVGDSGYWQLTIPLDFGEHHYSFIVDGKDQMADPTVPARQKDDFGGENSILKVGNRT